MKTDAKTNHDKPGRRSERKNREMLQTALIVRQDKISKII